MCLDCVEVTNQCDVWSREGRKHHPARGALGKPSLALFPICSMSRASLSVYEEQLALSWSTKRVDVQHGAYNFQGMAEKSVLTSPMEQDFS